MEQTREGQQTSAKPVGAPKVRKHSQVIRGRVISDSMNKTRVIETRRTIQHGLYHKGLLRKSHLFVHDEKNVSKVGDLIEVVSTRPLSKNKSFRLAQIVEKANEKKVVG